MSDANVLKARNAIASALKCSPDAIGSDANLDTLPEWDSIGHVHIVLEIEAELSRKLSPEEIAGIGSVADVARLYGNRTAAA